MNPQSSRAVLPTAAAVLVHRRDDGRLECEACAHRCALKPGDVGLCGVRQRQGDVLHAPFGYVAAQHVRAIETNTVYHVRPGAAALTFGMFGCDFRCPYCQNWQVSQVFREGMTASPTPVTPAALVETAIAAGCEALCAAYNEPMIAAEWVLAVFREARAAGLTTGVVSDGNTTPEALAFLRPVTDFYRVDLKAFTEAQYAVLGGRLDTVLAAIPEARALGYWVEVVTLVVPGFNDDPRGLRWLAEHLAGIDRNIPWHLNAFYPRYQWRARPAQSAGLLVSAAGTAYAKGLRYVYVGNLADRVRQLAQTRCPDCQHVVVARHDYRALAIDLADGRCPACSAEIPGVWTAPPRTGTRAA